MTQILSDQIHGHRALLAERDTVTCPECGQDATVEWRTAIEGTDGLVEHVKIRCPDRHWFLRPTDLFSTRAQRSLVAR